MRMLNLVWSYDKLRNSLPSMHVSVATMVDLTIWRELADAGHVCVLFPILIAISALKTKQHYVVDVVPGALLGQRRGASKPFAMLTNRGDNGGGRRPRKRLGWTWEKSPAGLPPYFLAFYLQYEKANRHPGGETTPAMFRALTERLSETTRFQRVDDARPDFVMALRKAYSGSMPVVAVPVETTKNKDRARWSDEEVNILAAGSRERWSIQRIAIACRRTHVAIRNKASELGFSLSQQ
jgi:hypothetical protein